MEDQLRRYFITAYTEWETLDVEALCPEDERAIDKARRYASLKYLKLIASPTVIFGHVVCDERDGLRTVGTWEYRISKVPKSYVRWHRGDWRERPLPEDRAALRAWVTRPD
jgi:hypothetical protein